MWWFLGGMFVGLTISVLILRWIQKDRHDSLRDYFGW